MSALFWDVTGMGRGVSPYRKSLRANDGLERAVCVEQLLVEGFTRIEIREVRPLIFGSPEHEELRVGTAGQPAKPAFDLRSAIEDVREWVDSDGTGRFLNSMRLEIGRMELGQVLAAAESTLPKTKTVEVWHVEYAVKRHHGGIAHGIVVTETRSQADEAANNHRRNGASQCVRVTGPHQHEVPA